MPKPIWRYEYIWKHPEETNPRIVDHEAIEMDGGLMVEIPIEHAELLVRGIEFYEE